MKTIRFLVGAFLLTAPMALLAQSKNEMPFTGSPEANKMVRQAWMLIADVKFDEAGKLAQEFVAKDPTCAMAVALLPTTDRPQFEAKMAKAESLKLSADEKLFMEALKASVRKDKPAQTFLNPLVKKYPKDDYLQLVSLLFVSDVKWKIQTGEALVKRNPTFAPAYNWLGYAYMDENMLPKAEAAFSKYVSLRPELANVYDSKGDYMMRVENFKEAAALYEKAVSLGMTDSKERAQRAAARMKYATLSASQLDGLKNIVTASTQEFQKGNLDAFFNYYADQAVEIGADQRTNIGKSNLRKRSEGVFRNGSFIKCNLDSLGAGGVGSIGVVWGNYDLIYKPNTGTEAPENGNVIFLFRKQKDGTWKILADHFYPASRETAADKASISELMTNWSNFVKTGEKATEKDLDALLKLYSPQALEITPNQYANVGVGNIKVRLEGMVGSVFQNNSLGTMHVEIQGGRAVAWGIGIQNYYPKDSDKLAEAAFTWAFILTKEKDDAWRILAIHWATE